uniref:Putative m20 peptidase n=1 Tax=Ixodes ricinus TaxID=34613 RepID=V5GZ70_IXORI
MVVGRVLSLLAALVAGLLLIVLTRTMLLPAFDPSAPLPSDTVKELTDSQRNFSGRLARALTFPTVSKAPHDYDREALTNFVHFLEQEFPRVHSSPLVSREVVSNHSLLLRIQGSDPSLQPYMLCAHMDVVPADPERWSRPPFAGDIADGYIWGRGALDAKDILMGILEAVEWMLETRTEFRRTLFLAFGHDEEVGGTDGAAAIAKILGARGVRLEYILDEGMVVLRNVFPGMLTPVAMIGVTEKGSLLCKLTARGRSSHSSFPPRETAIVNLAKALTKFHGQCHPSMFGHDTVSEMLETVAPTAPFLLRIVFANIWLFGPAISWVMSLKHELDAMIRTTTCVTRVQGGVKDNVVPGEAHAFINHRIHPKQSVAEVLAHNRALLSSLPNVSLEEVTSTEPHPVSPHSPTDFGYQTIARSAGQTFPGVAVAPTVLVANTDTRHYLHLTRNIYRFSPAYVTLEEARCIHGHDERISLWNYERLVNFYLRVIVNSNADRLTPLAAPGRKAGEL